MENKYLFPQTLKLEPKTHPSAEQLHEEPEHLHINI